MSPSTGKTISLEGREYYEAEAQRWAGHDATLFPAEVLLLHKLKGQWPQTRMLDIGIGGGRTTAIFSGIAKSYVGIDYSNEMCDAVRWRFPDIVSSIQCVDARVLSRFDDSSFDLVLFSFNGIDHVAFDERPGVFSEMRRVLRDGGLLLFSTHCLGVLVPRMCPGIPLRKRLRYVRQNPSLFLARRHSASHAVVREGRMRVVYVDPIDQWMRLEELGLPPTQAIDRTGQPVHLDGAGPEGGRGWEPRHWWIHIFCVARK